MLARAFYFAVSMLSALVCRTQGRLDTSPSLAFTTLSLKKVVTRFSIPRPVAVPLVQLPRTLLQQICKTPFFFSEGQWTHVHAIFSLDDNLERGAAPTRSLHRSWTLETSSNFLRLELAFLFGTTSKRHRLYSDRCRQSTYRIRS